MLVSEFLNNWLNTYGKHNLKLTTQSEYSRHINQYINPRIGDLNIDELKPLIIQNLYYELLDNGRQRGDLAKPLNAKTVLQTHRILHKAFKNAVQLEIINTNPADNVELPRKKKYNYNIILDEQLKDFLEAFKGTHIYNGVMLAVLLGLRRGELLALQFKDIDKKNKLMKIDKTVVNSKGIVKIDTTKTESSNRTILLSDNMINFIDNIYRERLEPPDNSYIICNIKGEIYNPGSFSRLYTWTRDSKKLPKIRFHDLRHIHATILYKSGIKAKVIQERLGHSNISTTLDIYTHLFKEDQTKAADIITDIILTPTDFHKK